MLFSLTVETRTFSLVRSFKVFKNTSTGHSFSDVNIDLKIARVISKNKTIKTLILESIVFAKNVTVAV